MPPHGDCSLEGPPGHRTIGDWVKLGFEHAAQLTSPPRNGRSKGQWAAYSTCWLPGKNGLPMCEGKVLPGGHNLPDGSPNEVLAELQVFLKT